MWSLFCEPAVCQGHSHWTATGFGGDSSGGTRWEHTQPWALSSLRKSHPPFSLLKIFLFSSFLQRCEECSLYGVAAVHWSDSPPVSHTHPMCLLLATLAKREKLERWEREEGGGIWYALCTSDLYKTKKKGKYVENVWKLQAFIFKS